MLHRGKKKIPYRHSPSAAYQANSILFQITFRFDSKAAFLASGALILAPTTESTHLWIRLLETHSLGADVVSDRLIDYFEHLQFAIEFTNTSNMSVIGYATKQLQKSEGVVRINSSGESKTAFNIVKLLN